MLRRLVVLEREALVGGVPERGGHDDDGANGDERSGDRAAHDLPLAAGDVDGEAGGGGRRRRREEGAGEREDVEAAGEVDDGAGARAGLPDGDVGDGAGGAEHADTDLAAARERGDAVDEVAPGGDLEDVRPQRAGAVARDDDRRLGLVLGACGAAPGTPDHHRRRRPLLVLLLPGLLPLLLPAAPVAPAAVDGVVALIHQLLLRHPTRRRRRRHKLLLLLLKLLERRRVVRPAAVVERVVVERRHRWRSEVVVVVVVVPTPMRRRRRHRIHLSPSLTVARRGAARRWSKRRRGVWFGGGDERRGEGLKYKRVDWGRGEWGPPGGGAVGPTRGERALGWAV